MLFWPTLYTFNHGSCTRSLAWGWTWSVIISLYTYSTALMWVSGCGSCSSTYIVGAKCCSAKCCTVFGLKWLKWSSFKQKDMEVQSKVQPETLAVHSGVVQVHGVSLSWPNEPYTVQTSFLAKHLAVNEHFSGMIILLPLHAGGGQQGFQMINWGAWDFLTYFGKQKRSRFCAILMGCRNVVWHAGVCASGSLAAAHRLTPASLFFLLEYVMVAFCELTCNLAFEFPWLHEFVSNRIIPLAHFLLWCQ